MRGERGVAGIAGVSLEWSFRPDTVRFYPQTTSPWAHMGLGDVGPITRTDSLWSGTFVHPGTVLVGMPGEPAQDSAHIDVSPRGWGVLPVDTFDILVRSVRLDDPVFQDDSVQLGLTYGRDLGDPLRLADPDVAFVGSSTTAPVQSGPNAGYHYVVSTTYQMPKGYSVNRWVEPPGFPWYFGMSTTQYVLSRGFSPENTLDAILAHEVADPFRSHFARARIAAASFDACGDLYSALERLVAPSEVDLQSRIANARNLSLTTILWASSHEFVHGFVNPAAHKWASWRTASPSLDSRADALTTDLTRSAPHSGFCDVGGLQ